MRSVVLFFLILIPFLAQGQQNILYPDAFGVNINNLSLINSWYVPDNGKFDFTGAYKYRTGPFSKIATYSATAAVISRKDNNRVQAARVIFFNQKEGPYIEKPRAYINYIYQIPLNEQTSLSAGVTLGFAGVFFSAPSSTAAGSVFLPDGSLGLGLKRKKFSAGISSFQIFNSKGSPLTGRIILKRYYHLFLSGEKDLSPDWIFKGFLLWGLMPSQTDRKEASISFTFKDALSVGSAFRYKQGLSFFSSFQTNAGKNVLLLSFGYNTSFFASSSYLQNSMELLVGYRMN
jgi:hypothetical protein